MTLSHEVREPHHDLGGTHTGDPGAAAAPTRQGKLLLVVALGVCLAGASVVGIAIVQSTATTSPSNAPQTTAPVGAGGGTPNTSATAIGRSFNSFFDFSTGTVSDKLAVVQGGAKLRQALKEAVSTSFARAATGASVRTTKMLDTAACAKASLVAPCAQVTYDVLGTMDSVILPGAKGYAVSRDGNWKVAKITACGLFELFYEAAAKSGTPPGC
jgi:hypothetical protein